MLSKGHLWRTCAGRQFTAGPVSVEDRREERQVYKILVMALFT